MAFGRTSQLGLLLMLCVRSACGFARPVHLAAGDVTAEELFELSRRRADKPIHDTDTFLVVFASEILPEDRDMLRSLLGEGVMLEYVPETALIAHGSTSVLPELRGKDRVAVACVLPPRLRLSSSLSAHCSQRSGASFVRRGGGSESELVVRLRPGAPYEGSIETLRRLMGNFAAVSDLGSTHLVVAVHDPARVCEAAAALTEAEGVYMVSLRSRVAFHNWFATKVVQQGIQASSSQAVPIWEHGINGRNMIVGVGDSGLDWDNCYFSDTSPPQYNQPSRWLARTHRKIIAYYYDGTGDDSDSDEGHGTHVVGSIVGEYIAPRTSLNGPAPQFDRFNGIAYKAKVVFTDIVSPRGGTIGVPDNLTDTRQASGGYYARPYDAGARVHCDSWGSDANEYDVRAQSVDQFAFQNLVSGGPSADWPSASAAVRSGRTACITSLTYTRCRARLRWCAGLLASLCGWQRWECRQRHDRVAVRCQEFGVRGCGREPSDGFRGGRRARLERGGVQAGERERADSGVAHPRGVVWARCAPDASDVVRARPCRSRRRVQRTQGCIAQRQARCVDARRLPLHSEGQPRPQTHTHTASPLPHPIPRHPAAVASPDRVPFSLPDLLRL